LIHFLENQQTECTALKKATSQSFRPAQQKGIQEAMAASYGRLDFFDGPVMIFGGDATKNAPSDPRWHRQRKDLFIS
jgi:hypothetical protein